jgi:hypothetical protein
MTKDRVKLRKPRRAVALRVWKKEMRAANALRRRNPKGDAAFVRDLAAQNNGDAWLDNEISPEADYAIHLDSARRVVKRRNCSIEDAARAYGAMPADRLSTNCEAPSGI